MIRKAVVPVAGLGTRMLPLTRSVPKEMLPLGRKPAIHHVVDELAAAGIERILFVTSSRKKAIEEYFVSGGTSDGAAITPGGTSDGPPALGYSFVRQEIPGGNGDAVRLGKAFAGSDAFVVAWGDAVLRSTGEDSVLLRMMATHVTENAACTIAVEHVPEDKVSRYGIVKPRYVSDAAFPIDDIVEKPPAESAPSRYAVSARYICGPGIFPALEATPRGRNGELWLADAIRGLLGAGDQDGVAGARGPGVRGRPDGEVWCVPLGSADRRYDIGTPLTYWEAFADYAVEDEVDGPAFRDLLRGRMNES
ncbi:MAG: NTP transferase domain-containing protein [Gemmatimonadetes bacterium]|nr:NTP transferase domain-containing protein [Gemmatimonadota bacterium]MYH19016.1 NTP transferase domain-containing protein [Gemmatimonadota bacterium]MYK99638.1 NTP transferase domain-containing protein [Gemmatimonadota bacterium]